MSSVSPVNGISQLNKGYFSALPNGAGAAFASFGNFNQPKPDVVQINSTEKTENKDIKEAETKKKKLPWKKIGIGILLASAFIELNLRHDPRRKRLIKEYADVFSNTTGTEVRNFSMIPYREEVIITEAANGSKKANELLPKLSCDGEGIKKYIQRSRRLENGRKLFIEGRFEHYRPENCSNRQLQRKVIEDLQTLQKSTEELYQRCIEPLCQT